MTVALLNTFFKFLLAKLLDKLVVNTHLIRTHMYLKEISVEDLVKAFNEADFDLVFLVAF